MVLGGHPGDRGGGGGNDFHNVYNPIYAECFS